MLRLGLVSWLASPLVTTCAPVSFHLDSCFIGINNILDGHVLIFLSSHQSLLHVHLPNHLAVLRSFGSPSQIIPPMKYGRQRCARALLQGPLELHPCRCNVFSICSSITLRISEVTFEAWSALGTQAIVPVSL